MALYFDKRPVTLHLGNKPYKLNVLFGPMKYVELPVLAARDGELDNISDVVLQSKEWRLLSPYFPDILSTSKSEPILDDNTEFLSVDDNK